MQGALALQEIGPEHRQTHLRFTQLEPFDGGNDLTWYRRAEQGFSRRMSRTSRVTIG